MPAGEPAGPKIKARPSGKVDEEDAKPAKRKNKEDDRDDADDERPTRSKRARDEDEDDRPRGKKKGGSKAPLIIGVVAAVLLLSCGGLAAIGYYVTQQAKKEVDRLDDEPPLPPRVLPKNDKVIAANFQKLKPLMTQAEVEAVLGPGVPAHGFDVSTSFAVGATPRGWTSSGSRRPTPAG